MSSRGCLELLPPRKQGRSFQKNRGKLHSQMQAKSCNSSPRREEALMCRVVSLKLETPPQKNISNYPPTNKQKHALQLGMAKPVKGNFLQSQ